jgi:hypothetical protein
LLIDSGDDGNNKNDIWEEDTWYSIELTLVCGRWQRDRNIISKNRKREISFPPLFEGKIEL